MTNEPTGTYKIDKVEPVATNKDKAAVYALGRNMLVDRERIDKPKEEWDEILIVDGDAKGIIRNPELRGSVSERLRGWYKITEVEETEITFGDRATKLTSWRGDFRDEYSEGDYVKLHRKVVKHCKTI